ncbi:MAG: methylenetetrahydrofolate--tRNA-(uracil(54)-C(5)) -methyltransferase (FADH(2)-oxidizing) TrmFO [bacterium]
MTKNHKIAVIGAGLAGSEAAFFLLKQGFDVSLFEMKPQKFTEAHKLPTFAELVCSNSLKSMQEGSPSFMLKKEMEELGSIIINNAYKCKVPAGLSLAVDRVCLSREVTDQLLSFTNLIIERKEIISIPEGFDYYIIATGPLTTPAFATHISSLIGSDFLYFYDAIAPIIDAESIDFTRVFKGSRYNKGGDDFINIPLTEEQYLSFVNALRGAEKVVLRPFEKEIFYEGCMPIEVMAERGLNTLAYGPMKPVGFDKEIVGFEPYAVIQLRSEDRENSAYNMVGFQTKLTYKEQERIFRMLPGLEKAEFLRYGSIHRNTFVDAPQVISPFLHLYVNDRIYLAGQITGVEGYVESAALGLLAGIFLTARIKQVTLPEFSAKTALGALLSHLKTSRRPFQPSGIHYGLFDKSGCKSKKEKKVFIYTQERDSFAQLKETLKNLSLI